MERADVIRLRENERLDDLKREGLRIIQRADLFRFGTDAVLLSDFANVKPRERICDLGTGSGILPLLLIGREPSLRIDAVEIQPAFSDMAARSVDLNGLCEKIQIHTADLRDLPQSAVLLRGSYDRVVCNPPYAPAGRDTPSENESVRVAREEVCCSLADVARAAFYLLKNGGGAFLVLRIDRLTDALLTMRERRLEPKTLRFIHHRASDPAKLALIECRKLGKPGVNVLPPLILRNNDESKSDEYLRIYGER